LSEQARPLLSAPSRGIPASAPNARQPSGAGPVWCLLRRERNRCVEGVRFELT